MPLLAERLRPTVAALLVLAIALFTAAARAEVPILKRGVNFELWQHWTNRSDFLRPDWDRTNFPDWSKVVDDRRLAALHAQGFDFVRLNVDPSPFLWNEEGRPRLFAAVAAAVDRLLAADFRVIVDLHLVPETADRPDGLHAVLGNAGAASSGAFDRYLDLVRAFARAYRDAPPDRVALELMNEPDDDWFSWTRLGDRWPARLVRLHEAARAVAPRLPLVLTGARGSSAQGLLRIDPKPFAGDDAVIWTFHYYEPYAVTHAGLPWTRDAAHFLTEVPFPARSLDADRRFLLLEVARARIDLQIAAPSERAAMAKKVAAALDAYVASDASPKTIDAAFDEVAQWAKTNRIPPDRILLGEFGAFREGADPAAREAVVAVTRRAAERAGFSWAIYTAGLTVPLHSFGILADTTTMRLEPEIARALGLDPPPAR